MFQPDAKAKAWIDDIVANATQGKAVPDHIPDSLNNCVSLPKKKAQQWSMLSSENKVSIGLSYVLAAMMAVSGVSRFAHAAEKDEQGHRHFNMSHVTYGVISTLLAAGMAYLGHAQFKAAAR